MIAVALLSILPHIAAPVEVCGTGSSAHRAHLDRVAGRSAARKTLRPLAASPDEIRLDDGIAILTASDQTVFDWKKFDLDRQAFRFTPNGNGRFWVSRSSAQPTPRGSRLALDSFSTKYRLTSFVFPFGGRSVTDLYLTPRLSIYLEPVEENIETWQYSAYQTLAPQRGIIAPLLTAHRGARGADVYVRETADQVSITWIETNSFHQYEVRADLFRDGTIEFSYVHLPKPPFGGVAVITSGGEAWRQIETELAAATDPTGDTEGPSPELGAMLDITRSRITRNRMSRLRFEVELREPVDFSRIPAGTSAFIGFSLNGSYFFVELDRNGIARTHSPSGGIPTPAAVHGAVVTFDIVPSNFPRSSTAEMVISTSHLAGISPRRVDEVRYDVELLPDTVPVETDFSLLPPTGTLLDGPIVETFTVPSLDETAVWETLQCAYGLRDDDYDAVAIYQTFETDIVFWAAGYAIVGNPMVTGISNRPRWGTALNPTLINVDRVGRNQFMNLPRAHLLLHEFGHRWLFYAEFQDGTSISKALLGRQDSHPHHVVDTRAAYAVGTPLAYSAMGGNNFTAVNSHYRTAEAMAQLPTATLSAGYSWFDLYLMGLADPAEVPACYYLADEAWDPSATAFQGRRVDVTLEQVIRALGPRVPAYPNTKRAFKVAFVLLTDPTREPTSAEISLVKSYRAAFERDFALATGGRAFVTTSIPLPPGRRRAARH